AIDLSGRWVARLYSGASLEWADDRRDELADVFPPGLRIPHHAVIARGRNRVRAGDGTSRRCSSGDPRGPSSPGRRSAGVVTLRRKPSQGVDSPILTRSLFVVSWRDTLPSSELTDRCYGFPTFRVTSILIT